MWNVLGFSPCGSFYPRYVGVGSRPPDHSLQDYVGGGSRLRENDKHLWRGGVVRFQPALES